MKRKDTVRLYINGTYYTEIGNPYDLDSWWAANTESLGNTPLSALSFDLGEVKAWKEVEIRDIADAEYKMYVRSLEADVTIIKISLNRVLNAEEQGVRDEMQARYQKLKQTVVQVRGAADWRTCLAITYVYP